MPLTPRKGGDRFGAELPKALRIEVQAVRDDRRASPRTEGGSGYDADVHAELAGVVSGRKPGRTAAEEIIILDSSGTALQDVAAAAVVYEKAARERGGTTLNFAS
ncbi:MAG: hypothetical protein ACHQ7N_02895 [Candidatus Methylomirabilales bacterium]